MPKELNLHTLVSVGPPHLPACATVGRTVEALIIFASIYLCPKTVQIFYLNVINICVETGG